MNRNRLGVGVTLCVLILIWVFWPSAVDTPPSETPSPAQKRAKTTTPQSPWVASEVQPSPQGEEVAEKEEGEEGKEGKEEEEPEWTLKCPIPMETPYEGDVDFIETIPTDEGVLMSTRAAKIEGGVLHVNSDDPQNRGKLRVPGYPDVRWTPTEEGGCPKIDLMPGSGIVGTVTPAWGEVHVRACGTNRRVDPDGSFYLPVLPNHCTVSAYRNDSTISVDGDSVEVEVVAGKDTVVDLTVPDQEWGSLGITMLTKDDRAVIESVWPGSIADKMGLEVGDVVLEVDGEPAKGCDRGWLFNCLHGPIGTEVTLKLEGETIDVKRGRLPKRR